MASERSAALRPVVQDLQRIFNQRLDAIVAYGWRHHGPIPSLALVKSIELDDLNACAARVAAWRRAGAATPLLLTRADFERSLDAFPIEYGEILTHHEVVLGNDPFAGLSIRPQDLRRACEVQAKSHLLHLREDYIESGARPAEVDPLVRESAMGFVQLLRHLARLDEFPARTTAELITYATTRIRLHEHTVSDLLELADGDGLPTVDTLRLFPDYLATMERLVEFVDRWREA
jgi:hypothetical protein